MTRPNFNFDNKTKDMKKKLKATHAAEDTPLKLGAAELPCYVLEDGTRVFSGRGMQKVLGASSKASGNWLKKYVTKSALTAHLEPGVLEAFKNPIIFKRIGAGGSQSDTYGYEVTILIDLCISIIDSKKTRVKMPDHIVAAAELIVKSVAKVGIIALVDEATGYQYDREKDELQKILKAYVSEELLPWQKKFPDIFYKELFRLNKWDFTVKGIKKRPGVVGKWTNTLIYDQLPMGVLSELKENTPKSKKGNYTARLHQSLSTDIGNPHLAAQINQITTLFQLSDNMKHMWSQFEKLKSRQQGQLVLPFDFDNKGYTVEPKKDRPVKLSKFNKDLKKALDFNPRDKK